MAPPKKITQKEYKQFVGGQMHSKGFSRNERDVVRNAFAGDLEDVDYGEKKPLFGKPRPGITAPELEDTMSALKNKNSPVSKGLKTKLNPRKLDELEKILTEALEKNKERGL